VTGFTKWEPDFYSLFSEPQKIFASLLEMQRAPEFDQWRQRMENNNDEGKSR
jgi:hypothetical protein